MAAKPCFTLEHHKIKGSLAAEMEFTRVFFLVYCHIVSTLEESQLPFFMIVSKQGMKKGELAAAFDQIWTRLKQRRRRTAAFMSKLASKNLTIFCLLIFSSVGHSLMSLNARFTLPIVTFC